MPLRFLAAILCVFLAGCAYPYRPPEFQGAQSFLGARDFAQAGGQQRVRLIMTHGMCSGSHKWFGEETNWVANRLDEVAKAVGAADFTLSPRDQTAHGLKFPSSGPTAVRRFDYEMTGADGVIYELALLTWGERIDLARNDLLYENAQLSVDPDLPRRARLNATLKSELMDACLIDAVYYLGDAGDPIRAAMHEALCDYLGGRISGPDSGAPGQVATCAGMRAPDGVPLMLVPESLGSKVLFDAVTTLGATQTGRARTAAALGDLRAIHFATNQLPLLNQADGLPGAGGSDKALSGAGAPLTARLIAQFPSPEKAVPAPVEVVVYTDPNDPFGYRLRDSDLGAVPARLTNVIVSNTGVFLGLVADPVAAHRDTARPEIFDLIVSGHAGPR